MRDKDRYDSGWESVRKDVPMATSESQDLAQRAEQIYNQRLRHQLEQTHHDWFVAIEPDSGDYFLGRKLDEAIRSAHAAHPATAQRIARQRPTAVSSAGCRQRER